MSSIYRRSCISAWWPFYGFLGTIIFIVGCGQTRSAEQPTQDLPKAVYDCLRNGDLILRYGKGILSSTLAHGLAEARPFSHAGILVNHEEEWYVWHALSNDYAEKDGLQAKSLRSWLAEARTNAYLISRYRAGEVRPFLQAAQRLMLAEIPFDKSFDFADSTEMYCTEFLYHALRDAGQPYPEPHLLNSGVVGLDFEPFYDGKYFEVVYDPEAELAE